MHRLLTCFCSYFLALILACIPASHAAADQGVITMTYEEFPPYSFTGNAGQARGLSIDVMNHLAAEAGYEVQFISSINPAQSMQLVNSGAADSTALLALTPARLEIGRPTTELGAFEMRAFVLKNRPEQNTDALSGQKIGVVAGSFAINGAERIPFAQMVEFAETDSLIIPLLTGEIDAAVSAGESFLGRLREADVEQLVRQLDPPLISSPFGFIVAPDRADLQAALNTAIETTLQPRDMALLRQRWFGKSKTLTDYNAFWWAIAAVLLALTAFGLIGRTAYHHKKQSERLLRDNAANDLLIGALNQVAASIVIYDANMKATHWNRGFEQTFPSLIKNVETGCHMRHLLARSYLDGSITSQMKPDEIEVFLDDIVQKVKDGSTETRTIRAASGQVFEARDFRLGPYHYASIRVDVTRLQAQQDTIERQAKGLVVANDQLQVFASVAAHDLRAPLGQQQGLMQMITEDLEDADITLPEGTLANWAMVEGLSKRMMQLIQDLLEFARSENRGGKAIAIDPSARLAEVIELVANKDGFEILIDAQIPQIMVNATAFDTVLRNLISNSIKHHDKNAGRIHVSGEVREGMVYLSVADDGPGVPEQFRARIFEPFERLNSNVEGSGLGLAYIKKTVLDWGGTVAVYANHPRGSIFMISAPRSEDPKVTLAAA